MQILSKINWVDVIVVILILRMSYVAFMDGLSHEIFPLFGSIIVFVLSLSYYVKLGGIMVQSLGMPSELANCLAFIILVVIAGFIVKFLRIIIDKLVKVQWHPVIERFGGLLAGVVKAYIITAIILTILVLMPFSYLRWSIKERSLTGKYVLMAGPGVYEKFKDIVPDNSVTPKKAPAQKASS